MEKAKKYYPTLGQSFALLLIFLLVMFITMIVFMYLERGLGRLDIELAEPLQDALLNIVPIIFTCWIGIRQKKSYEGTVKSLSFKTVPALTLLLLLAGTICLSNIIDMVIYLLPLPEGEFLKRLEEAVQGMVSYHPIIATISIAILPGIFEEILFRGLILEGFLKRYSPWTAIFLSSLLFGMFHLNPWQFIAGLGGGIFLGWVYYRTRSLWACMFIHIMNNFGILVGYWLTNRTDLTLYDTMDKQTFTIYLIITVVALVIAIRLLKRQFNKAETPTG